MAQTGTTTMNIGGYNVAMVQEATKITSSPQFLIQSLFLSA